MSDGMTRRGFLRAAAAAWPVLAGARGARASRGERPDIVLILADDMGFSDLACYGSEIRTPHIDGLAARGIRFSQFYNTARCCPTRASLLTGLYPHQTGVGHMMGDRRLPGYRGDLNDRCVTIAEALRPAGYRTRMVGKWHVTPVSRSKHNWPLQRGFEHFYGTITGAGSYYDPVTLTRDNEPIRAEGEGYYYTDALGENAVRFIEEGARRSDPFFLYVAYTAPHWPLHAPPEDIARYGGVYDKGWDALRAERHARMIGMGLVDARWPLTPRDSRVPPWEEAKHKAWQARRMAVYAAQIERMDAGVGRIVKALERAGRLENTLLLLLADNGGCAEEISAGWRGIFIARKTRDGRPVRVGNDPRVMPGPEDTYQSYGLPWANASNTPFRLYKHWVHEGGIATPLVVHWPARIRRSGSITHEPGHIVDLMATCIDVADASYPATRKGKPTVPLEGRSLLPILEGGKRKGHDAIFWEHEGNRAARKGRFKLVSRHPRGWELYDIVADRTEMTDLAEARPETVRELGALYDAWAERCGVRPWPLGRRR